MTWRVLDLFCGAGGAAMGLHRAWPDAEIIGIDNRPQPRYPFTFVLGDALNPPFDLRDFDFIWASPPCQHYSKYSRNIGTSHKHPDYIDRVRRHLRESKKPYIIENVPGAPMTPNLILCGSMFGLNVVRHRWFEIYPPVFALVNPCQHPEIPMAVYGNGTPQWHREKLGRNAGADDWRKAMDIDWMGKKGLAQAIPPAYSEYIARQIRK